MIKTKKFIKGVVVGLLLIGLMGLNPNPTANESVGASNVDKSAMVSLSNYWVSRTFAQEMSDTPTAEEYAASTGTDVSSRPLEVPAGEAVDTSQILETVAKVSTYVNNIFNPLIHYLTFAIGAFLGNDYIFAGNMGEMLHSVWVISRNIVNILFVLILLFLAVRYIFLGKEDETGLVKYLPKFALWLVLVNFSWFASKVVLDAGNVAANVVFAIPSGIQGVMGETKVNDMIQKQACSTADNKVSGMCMPTNFWYPADARTTFNFKDCTDDNVKNINEAYVRVYPEGGTGGDEEAPVMTDSGSGILSKGAAVICWQQLDLTKYNQNNASYYLSYSMARVQNLTRASTKDKISQLAIGTMFSLILQIVYLTAFLSVFVVLIFRIAMMWMFVGFSPFLVILKVLEEVKLGGGASGSVGKVFSVSQLMNWAFVPAKVGAVWAVGFIMITAGQLMTKGGDLLFSEKNPIKSTVFTAQSLFLGMDSIQQFIWLLMSVGIVWFGTFTALSDLGIATTVVNKIKGFGETVAKLPGQAAMAAPIFPVTDTQRMSLGQMVNMPSNLAYEIQQKYRGAPTGFGGATGAEALKDEKRIASLEKAMTLGRSTEEILNEFRSVAGSKYTNEYISKNFDEVRKLIEESNLKEKDKLIQRIKVEIVDKRQASPTTPATTQGGEDEEKKKKGKVELAPGVTSPESVTPPPSEPPAGT